MEQRVLVLGQENNLVKNLSEIVKNRRKWVFISIIFIPFFSFH